jgi:thiol-disulfide isomerase/thioredoxin
MHIESHKLPLLLALALLLAVAGCSRKSPPPAPAQPETAPAVAQSESTAHLPPGIDWFAGDVDAAFESAKAAGKPLFLFWGAEWCPPCAQIKSTIFNTREFQERSRLFVPVYLDGDTPSAQRQGERFGVMGYPTMILFRADGTEITRLPGGVDVARYATILDTALGEARPVAEILRAALDGTALDAGDWQLLAYYSWATDNGRLVPPAEAAATFRKLAAAVPPEHQPERGRLYFEFMRAAAAEASRGASPLDDDAREQEVRTLTRLLGVPDVASANVENLLYAPKDAIGVLSNPGTPERGQLITAWRAALDGLARGDGGVRLSGPEQLNVVRARVALQKLAAPDATLPPELLDEARATVARVDAAATETYARHAAVNAAANLYWDAGLDEDADRMLKAELERSKSPYYFMLNLAELAEKAGREQEAVDWLARAYAGAQGPATRFQWGYNYLVGLLEMTPEDTVRIERVALEVLGELGESPDAFYQRTQMRLEQLSTKLLDWGRDGEAAAVVGRLRARTGAICAGLPAGDPGRGHCEAFLSPAGPATAGA